MRIYFRGFFTGLCLLLAILLVWLLAGAVKDTLSDLHDDLGFYAGTILSVLILVVLSALFFYRIDSREQRTLLLALLFLPYVLLLSAMLVASRNLPRLLDMLIIGIGYVLILVLKRRSVLERWAVLSVFCLVSALTYPFIYESISYTIQPIGPTVGSRLPAPIRILRNVHNDTLQVQSLQGKVVCIDLWSSSCGSCIRDMPKLEKLMEAFKGREVAILSVYCPRDPSQTFKWYQQYIADQFPYAISYYYLEMKQVQQFGISRFPEFILLDRRGVVVFQGMLNYKQFVKGNIYDQLDKLLEIR